LVYRERLSEGWKTTDRLTFEKVVWNTEYFSRTNKLGTAS
jgi:hypothetical protein